MEIARYTEKIKKTLVQMPNMERCLNVDHNLDEFMQK